MQHSLTFEKYLCQMKHSSGTVKSYVYAVGNFLAICPKAEKYHYKDVIDYVNDLKNQYKNIRTVAGFLAAIKKYYDYLVEIGKREDHPCKSLHLKGTDRNRGVIHNDLFSTEELELLLQREERYPALKLKNQALVSLLIHQGLVPHEIVNLKVSHVDLERGTIYIKESRMLSRRHLEISAKQYRILDKYINETRGELLSVNTEALIVGKLGAPITVDDVHYIVSTYKPLFPDRNLTPTGIRQSVVANWLNEKRLPLEQVQLMAGHRWISTTIKYRQSNQQEERELINKWHPMG